MKINIVFLAFLLVLLIFHYGKAFPITVTEPLLVVSGILVTIPVIINAVKALFKKKISVDLLASIALFVSMVKGEWASVAFINLMITSARIFGEYTEGKAKSAIKGLLKLRPERVRVKQDDQLIEKHISDIHIGDILLVEAGERVPIDGVVVQGKGTIDQSSLTGESLPLEKHEGTTLLSSTLVVAGTFFVRTEKIGKDTTFEKIIALVENAQSGKASIQTMADRFASWYIVITLCVAVSLYFFTRDVDLILSVLLVTCADDIAVAVPLAFFAAIAYAAKRGIIIKGGNFLEGLTRVTTLLVDKTGTLTKGVIVVTDVYASGVYSKQQLLSFAGAAASVSQHPMSKAVALYTRVNHVVITTPETFDERPGKGVVAVWHNKHIVLGNKKLLEDEHIHISYDQIQQYNKKSGEGYSVLFVGCDGMCIGFITLADEIRSGMKAIIHTLKQLGVPRIIMLTGDNEKVAGRVMEATGITSFYANLLPEDKVAFVRSNKEKHHLLAMVGDGVNDAAALAAADIGIAMGTIGSDAAIESSDIALMHDDLGKISEAVAIGKHAIKVSHQNFVIWGVVNSIGLVLVFARLIGPAEAAAFNFITDFFPLMNSMRLFRRQSFDRVIG